MKPIPYTRPTISKKDLISVLEHLIDDDLSSGKMTEKFEKELGKTLGFHDRVILTNSGASALFLIFQHLNLNLGDEVILSALSEPWVGEVIAYFDAIPVWIDISMETLQMNPEHLKKKINSKTKAVIIHHHFGYPFITSTLEGENSPLDGLLHGSPEIKLIEDITSGLFTHFHDQYLGGFGNYAFTCLGNRRIITTGRGGAVFVKNRKEAKEIRWLRSSREKFPIEGKPDYPVKRLDLSLSDMQAALGLSELSLVEKLITRCEQIKHFYQDAIAKGRHSFITTAKEVLSSHHAFPVILHGDAHTAQKIFNKEKIEIRDLTTDTAYEFLPYHEELKNIHQLKHKVILIPIYPTLKKEEIEKITLLLNSIRS